MLTLAIELKCTGLPRGAVVGDWPNPEKVEYYDKARITELSWHVLRPDMRTMFVESFVFGKTESPDFREVGYQLINHMALCSRVVSFDDRLVKSLIVSEALRTGDYNLYLAMSVCNWSSYKNEMSPILNLRMKCGIHKEPTFEQVYNYHFPALSHMKDSPASVYVEHVRQCLQKNYDDKVDRRTTEMTFEHKQLYNIMLTELKCTQKLNCRLCNCHEQFGCPLIPSQIW